MLNVVHAIVAATTNVSPGMNTLQDAYDSATSGDVLVLADGTYRSDKTEAVIKLGSSSITIRAEHSGRATLDGQGARRGIYMSSMSSTTAVFEGLVVANGKASLIPNLYHGGGVLLWGGDSSSTVTFKSCAFTNSTAPYGGGMKVFGDYKGAVNLEACSFSGNTASASSSTSTSRSTGANMDVLFGMGTLSFICMERPTSIFIEHSSVQDVPCASPISGSPPSASQTSPPVQYTCGANTMLDEASRHCVVKETDECRTRRADEMDAWHAKGNHTKEGNRRSQWDGEPTHEASNVSAQRLAALEARDPWLADTLKKDSAMRKLFLTVGARMFENGPCGGGGGGR